jgi:hypothetical protein
VYRRKRDETFTYGSAELLKRHDIWLLLDWEIVCSALHRRPTFKPFNSTLSISRKASIICESEPWFPVSMFTYGIEEHSRDILWVWKVGENATALNDEVANDVEQDVLRPERYPALSSAGYDIPENPSEDII